MSRTSLSAAQVAVFKALGHPTRLRIVEILATQGSKCVCEIVDLLHFDQSTVSKHLALLRSVGIVRCGKEGLMVRYELNMRCVFEFMKCIERVETGSGDVLECGHACVTGGMVKGVGSGE